MKLKALPNNLPHDWLVPSWSAPASVCALMTTRNGGYSVGAYGGSHLQGGMNVGTRCGDDPETVARNRDLLNAFLPAAPAWLKQVHGADIVHLNGTQVDEESEVDAVWTATPGVVCAVQVADCMPVLLCTEEGSAVAAAHAGWRGLAGGVVEASVRAICEGTGNPPEKVMAWLGPCIGPLNFEVGTEVLEAFTDSDAQAIHAFARIPGKSGKWLADLPALARRRLERLGVTRVSGESYCTVSQAERFYSFRRDKVTGRMVALIWIDHA